MTRLLLLAAFCVLALPARAETDPATRDIYREMNSFTKNLTSEQTRHFYLLYNNYNLIKSVETVRTDISKAVDSCSQNNPDMADKMQDRFEDWTEEVDPVMKNAENKLNEMVASQKYRDPQEILRIFGLIDETREKANSEISKIPVKTPEACEYLLVKLDNTQEGMISILQATLVDYPETIPADGNMPPEPRFLSVEPPPKASKNK